MSNNIDRQYLELVNHILRFGYDKQDRTGTGTKSIFGWQIRHRMSEGFPLITTKKMAFKTMVTELLWFLKGRTDLKYLLDNDCYIWVGDAWENYRRKTLEKFMNDDTTIAGYAITNKEDFINKIKTDDKFAREWGDLGPVYGAGWRRWKTHNLNSVPVTRPIPNLREGIERTYLGVANGKGKEGHILAKTWEGMIARCYDPKSIEYPNYGACNVYVCDRWLEFKAFAEDTEKLPNWSLKKENPRDYVLDKDGIGTGYCYSLENCQWVTPTENANFKSNKKYIVEKDGVHYTFSNPTSFCRAQGISDKNFSDLWTGKKNAKKRNGFTLVSVTEDTKIDTIDQIANVINLLKTDPDSRRMIVNAWNVGELDQMVLPPCHMMFQFYTRELSWYDDLDKIKEIYVDWSLSKHCDGYAGDIKANIIESANQIFVDGWKKYKDPFTGKLLIELECFSSIPKRAISLMFNMRSNDVPLGLPFNLASYGLLLEILAKHVNMVPDELIANIGDAHIYLNQIEGVKEQLTRVPYELPTVRISDRVVNDISEYEVDDFILENYQCHPSIKLPLSN